MSPFKAKIPCSLDTGYFILSTKHFYFRVSMLTPEIKEKVDLLLFSNCTKELKVNLIIA
jgi:hypothetical protein